MKNAPENKAEPALIRTEPALSHAPKLPQVTPDQVDGLRSDIFRTVKNRLEDANKVLLGQKNWSSQQLKLFQMMLNKVMPDLHHNFADDPSAFESDVVHLTRAQLEALAAKLAGEEAKTVTTPSKKRKTRDDSDDIDDDAD